MKLNNCFLIILSLLAMTSCSSSSSSDDDTEIVYTNLLESIGQEEMKEQIDVNAQLAEAAYSVSNSLNKLAEIKLAEKKGTKDNTNNPLLKVKGMNEVSSIDWNGPVEPILKKIAKAGKHKFTALGRAPSIPVIVDLNMRNVTLAEILQNITYQASGKASITYNSKADTIELRYFEL